MTSAVGILLVAVWSADTGCCLVTSSRRSTSRSRMTIATAAPQVFLIERSRTSS